MNDGVRFETAIRVLATIIERSMSDVEKMSGLELVEAMTEKYYLMEKRIKNLELQIEDRHNLIQDIKEMLER